MFKKVFLLILSLLSNLSASEINNKIDCDYLYLWLKKAKLTTNLKLTVDLTHKNAEEIKKISQSLALARVNVDQKCQEEWKENDFSTDQNSVSSKVNDEVIKQSTQLSTDRVHFDYVVEKEETKNAANNKSPEKKAEVSFFDNITKRDRLLPLKNFPKIELFFRGSTNNSHVLGITNQRPNSILNAYRRMIPKADIKSCGQAPMSTTPEYASYKDCAQKAGEKTMKNFDRYIGKVSDKFIYNYANSFGTAFSDRDVSLLRHFHHMLAMTPSDGQTHEDMALDYLRSLKNKLTTDEKLTIAQMWGAQFLDQYDSSRAAAGGQAKGVVTLDQMLRATQYNNSINYFGENPFRNANSLTGGSSAEWAGICRDIASGQGKMLRALGMENTFVVSLAHDSGAFHTVTLTQDPDQPQKLYGLDYGDRHNIIGGNSDGLLNSPTDISMTYRIFIPGGRSVDNIQSTLGKVLSEASGFTPLDPLARRAPLMASAKIDLVKGLSLRAGHSTDHQAANYLFAGASYNWNSGQVSVTYARQDRQNLGSNRTMDDTKNLDIIYAQLEQRFKSKDLQFNKHLNARIEAMVGLMVMATHSSGGISDNAWGVQGDLYTELAAVFEQHHQNFEGKYKVGVQITPGIKDIRDNYIWQIPIPTLNHLFLSAEGRKDLAQTKAGRMYLIAATIILVDELGIRGRVQGGLQIGRIRIVGKLEGRLTNSTLNIQDGSERRAGINVEWNLTDFMSIVLDASTALGDDYAYSLNPFVFNSSLKMVF